MARYRAPTPPPSPYITRDGFNALQQELDGLWKRRSGVTRALAAAAAEGDRSENAEYIYRKKELREIDRRIRYLQKRLPVLKVVDTRPSNLSQVFFGARVTLEDEDGATHCYRIVGADEFNPGKGWISIDSPMARALLRKNVDDELTVQTGHGSRHYLIIEVDYPTAD